MTKKEEILAEAYRQFTEKGIANTRIDDIASGIKISKKTIYSLFRSKEDLFIQMVILRLNDLELKVESVINSDEPIITKMIDYIITIYDHAERLTLKKVGNAVVKREQIKDRMTEYLKGAVFGRFKKLLDQADAEYCLKEGTDLDSALMMYWESVSTFLFIKPLKSLPSEFVDRPVNELIARQLVNLYRGLLNEPAIREFDQLLENHPYLSGTTVRF